MGTSRLTELLSVQPLRKLVAITVGAMVVGIGATYTLASWSDSEWVWGGIDGDPGLGTSTFNVQQNVSSPFDGDADWVDQDTNPGNELVFSAGALSLSPGDSVYAPVALRTQQDSVGGDNTLQGAIPAAGISISDDDDDLWDAIQVSVFTAAGDTPPAPCNAAGIVSWEQILQDKPLGTVAEVSQFLAADAGSTQHYCFVVTLPAGADAGLQGRTIAPAWEFKAISQ